MKLIIIFITIILSSKSFSEPINDIDFVDGKYFAYIKDTNSLRWEIIIIKENNELKIEFLDVKRGKFDYEGLQVFIPKTELTNKLSSQEIDNTMEYTLNVRFYGTLDVNIYGTLGKSSRLSWRHSSYIHSADFTYISYKFYKTFKEEFKKNRQLTTNIFLEKFIN